MAHRYDSRTTTFSPEGRLFQVEYALEAISNASPTVAILAKDGIVIAADKAQSTKLSDKTNEREKVYVIDSNILCAVAGWTADANVLLNNARLMSQRHLYRYDESMPIEALVVQLCDVKHGYTQFGGLRPFGVSFLIAGYDQVHGLQLYHTDPAGNYSCWKATAIGQNSQSATSILKEEWTSDMTVEEATKLAARVLAQTTDQVNPSGNTTEFAVLMKEGDGAVIRYLTDSDVTKLMKDAIKQKSEEDKANAAAQ